MIVALYIVLWAFVFQLFISYVLQDERRAKYKLATKEEPTTTAELQKTIVEIYRHLGPDVPESVSDTSAAYEWRHALNIAKIQMGRFDSKDFYPGDKPPVNPDMYVSPHSAVSAQSPVPG